MSKVVIASRRILKTKALHIARSTIFKFFLMLIITLSLFSLFYYVLYDYDLLRLRHYWDQRMNNVLNRHHIHTMIKMDLVILIIFILISFVRIPLFDLRWSLLKTSYKSELSKVRQLFKGSIPPFLFLLICVPISTFVIYLIISLGYDPRKRLLEYGLIEITLTLILVFGLPLLLPATLGLIEQGWWRLLLGKSTAAQRLKANVLKDFRLSTTQWETDKGLLDPAPVIFAIAERLLWFPHLHYKYKTKKDEIERRTYKTHLRLLNEEWVREESPELLEDYMRDILELSKSKNMKHQEKLCGRCAVASVKYLSGNIRTARVLAKKNWRRVHIKQLWRKYICKKPETKNDRILNWHASYAYFVTKAFGLCKFDKTMKEMTKHWDEHYVQEQKKKELIDASYDLVFNPVVARPRNILLAAAFNESPISEAFDTTTDKKKQIRKQYWPSVARKSSGEFELKKNAAKIESTGCAKELKWVNYWYREARKISKKANRPISLAYSHAYAGFYFTLLLLDSECITEKRKLREKANKAFNSIDAIEDKEKEYFEKNRFSTAIVQHLKSGFRGIYKLAIEYQNASQDDRPEKALQALEDFRKAARHSDFNGHRSAIIDCLFMCCRAVAAQRTGRDVEANRYLKEGKNVASRIGAHFYFDLYNAARAEVESLRGRRWRVRYIHARLKWKFRKKGRAGERIIRILREEFPKIGNMNRAQRAEQGYESAIRELNEGWASTMAPELLRDYCKYIQGYSKCKIKNMSEQDRLRGQCAVATVKYLLGDINEAVVLAGKSWQVANKLQEAAENNSIPRWIASAHSWRASYAYFNTKAFGLCDFEQAMEEMVEHWHTYYASFPEKEQGNLRRWPYFLLLNPVLARPRNLILAAAFNESPPYIALNGSTAEKKRGWPSRVQKWPEKTFEGIFKDDELRSERRWVEHWYEEAKTICQRAKKEKNAKGEKIDYTITVSQAFDRACAGFYFTLLCLDTRCPEDMKQNLSMKARVTFESIKSLEEKRSENADASSDYVKSGFYGIYKLAIEKNPEEALKGFRRAAQDADFSGNRFGIVDYLFICCHAVAAQRVEPPLEVEVNRYLKEAENVAERIGVGFYSDLYDAVRAEIESLRGNKGTADRIDARLRTGQAGERIIRIFRKNFERKPRSLKEMEGHQEHTNMHHHKIPGL